MGITGRPSCKQWRSVENRRYRAYAKNLMRHERYDDIQVYKGRFGNEWSSPRDGWTYFGHYKNQPCVDRGNYPGWRWWSWLHGGCWLEKNVHFCHKAYKELMRK